MEKKKNKAKLEIFKFLKIFLIKLIENAPSMEIQ